MAEEELVDFGFSAVTALNPKSIIGSSSAIFYSYFFFFVIFIHYKVSPVTLAR